MSQIRYLGIIAAINIFSACNPTKFASAPNSGKEPGPPSDRSLSCTVSPLSLKAGMSANIQIVAGAGITGPIFQSILGEDSPVNVRLKRDGASFLQEAGLVNAITPHKNAPHTVELRLTENSPKADATCSFVVSDDNLNVELPICAGGTKSIGAHIAFIVDNSNSNSTTDCPSPVKTGMFNGAATFQCQGETNREKAVMSSFDILEGVATSEAANADATSTVSVASFPTQESYTDGWKIQTNGWINATGVAGRQSLAQSMIFSRSPFGLTPYGAGLAAATELFSSAPNDGKAKILVFVTDGEPTDRDPLGIASQATAIKAADIEIITVFITGSETRTQRKANHAEMLRQFNNMSIQDNNGPWYTNNIGSFDEYIGLINGTAQVSDLVSQMSTQSDLSCVEQGGKKCGRLIVEVSNSAGLRSVLETIIKTRAIKCE